MSVHFASIVHTSTYHLFFKMRSFFYSIVNQTSGIYITIFFQVSSITILPPQKKSQPERSQRRVELYVFIGLERCPSNGPRCRTLVVNFSNAPTRSCNGIGAADATGRCCNQGFVGKPKDLQEDSEVNSCEEEKMHLNMDLKQGLTLRCGPY